ncbi:porin [Shimia sp.]|uniref:porin n=1 Tax=Shimia sp. TaxID=1954381 RepID=UPI0032977F44
MILKRFIEHTTFGATSAVLAMAPAFMASAQETVPVDFYGHINPTFLSFDDGVSSNDYLTDNDHSNTRVGFWVRDMFNTEGLSFNFETALGLPSSSATSQISTPDWEWDATKLRKVDISYAGDWGKIYVGQGSMSTDGIGQKDFSGTDLVAYAGIADSAGSFLFRNAAGALTTREVGDVFTDLDGGRRGRLRYDTPSFSGFTLSASVGEEILKSGDDNTYYDLSASYKGGNDDVAFEAGLGSAWADTSTGTRQQTVGSVAVLHKPSGVNGTLAGGSVDGGGDYFYAKAGIIRKWFGVGTTAVAVDYFQSNGFIAGEEGDAVGFGVVQKFDDQNIEAYFGYRDYDLTDTTGAVSYRGANHYMLGARFKF